MTCPAHQGWGPGWPYCQEEKWEYVVVPGLDVSFGRARKEIVPLMIRLIQECVLRGYVFKDGQCWGANCRAIRGSNSPSVHSWGLALDFNSLTNWLGREDGGDIPSWMVTLWNEYGFRWGGNYSGREDPMHFEFMGTPADVVRLAEKARNEGLGEDRMTDQEKKQLEQALEMATFAFDYISGISRFWGGMPEPMNEGPKRLGWRHAKKAAENPVVP